MSEIYAEGAPVNEEFAKVQASDAGCTEMGITSNKHTEFTYAQLENKKVSHAVVRWRWRAPQRWAHACRTCSMP